MTGILYITATPIGNLDDISQRAVDILSKVDIVAAEDTRHSKRLLQHLGINTRLVAVHDNNESARVTQIMQMLSEGKSVALISDAGTPLISDPGYVVVRAAHVAGHRVVPIPGACAVIAALSAAGLPTDQFHFVGFLSPKSSARKKELQQVQHVTHTLVFYEAPHRIQASLQDMKDVFGEQRIAVIARELTKTFETIKRASLNELIDWVDADENQRRGEFVILIHGAEAADPSEQEAERILNILLDELPVKQAASLTAKITGLSKNKLYQQAISK